ncbi:bestrophin family protein [Tuwongella immobilis]|uniref:Bestrophin, RFP-TM, chloride channel n=1 Tax=Tuwongella immobilis TaxID=692036 RepID=A0A6C2YK58_9BACT|nr:bestrophin family ion channel [Tuwongella immobilis]VIP01754.1 Uncharacterized protein OS=Planctomyces limnophilus (strain ATCC 43296 / DSM 3776 / IFAM 1008 / 290) GN=Plim_2717 PE=4 SV=1: Bestrophin [Tuwongella immobilis]VTR99349.1 Uncharacterized protein OS=Planctomyces limnophilus (strain ATCC 43296 / DSM 3776 / IFAM 1008 / 290) GN=Plim_2717 PE=4 SV=1: Bestrophin [Tuwongella immobilis]
MILYDSKAWYRTITTVRGTVVPRIAGRVAILFGIALLVWILREQVGASLHALNPLAHTLIGVALGLLIVFRTNSSYDRYWEGRKQWGGIVNASRNLLRGATAYAGNAEGLTRLVAAYPLALKQHLRGNRDLGELESLIPADLLAKVAAAGNPPMVLAVEMSRWIHARVQRQELPVEMARHLEAMVATLLDCQGACERILRTPIPFVYAVHIRQLLTIYLVSLPFSLIPAMGWSALFAVPAIAFGMLGIEEAGVEIEDPFGDDPNDLPIEAICQTIQRDATTMETV